MALLTKKTADLAAPDFTLDTPLLNGSLSDVLDAPFQDLDRYDARISEASKALAAAEAAARAARTAAAEADTEADRAEVLVEIKEGSAADAKRARAAATKAAEAVADADRAVQVKRKAVAALRQIKGEAERKAQASAQTDADRVRAEKVAAMAEIYRALLQANVELCEVETRMQDRGLIRSDPSALLWDPELMPRHHSTFPRGGRAVVLDTRPARWFAAARRFGFDV